MKFIFCISLKLNKWSKSVSCLVMSKSLRPPLDCSSPGSSVHGILQARILEWTAIFFSRRSSWPRDLTPVSCITGGFFTIFTVELCGTVVKKPPISVGDLRDVGLIPGSGRSPGGGNGKLLQYFCLGNPMDKGDRWATGDVVSKSWRGLSTNAHTVEQSLLLNKGRDLNKFLKNEFPKRALEMKFLGVANHDSHNWIRDKLTSDNNKIWKF